MHQFHVVDDDPSIRRLVTAILEDAGHDVRCYADGPGFKAAFEADGSPTDCVLLDLEMPGESGVDVQRWLAGLTTPPPVIVITGSADIPTAVTLMKRGARDVLTKPFTPQQLLERVDEAVSRTPSQPPPPVAKADTRAGRALATLTPRERQVFESVAAGDANKQVAFKLGISQRTVEVHRARVMTKLNAESLADLVAIAIATGLRPAA
ncbi:MAG: response regulator [Planctomycetota bacterium]